MNEFISTIDNIFVNIYTYNLISKIKIQTFNIV